MSKIYFGEVFESGFNIWKNNLVICVPFILSIVISLAVAFVTIFLTVYLTILPSLNNFSYSMASVTSTNMFSQISNAFLQNILIFILVIIVLSIILGLINSFFSAGAIGMAKEAIQNGSTNLSHMIEYGRKKFLSFFGVSLLVSLIMAVGILFLIPAFINLSSLNIADFTSSNFLFSGVTTQFSSGLFSTLILLLVGVVLMGIYMLVMSIVLALVTYSVVLDDLKAIPGFKKGIKVFLGDKLNVFLIWLIVLGFGILFGILQNALAVIPLVGSIIGLIITAVILSPLTAIWWSKLYLSITRNEYTKPSGENIKIQTE